jgi:serine/threonine-protein kinase RsbW
MTYSSPLDFDRRIRVEAQTSCLAEIRRFVEEVAAEVALDIERVFDLKVAVSEACANAVQHAGCEAAVLEVCAHRRDQRLTFIITDRGLFRPPAPPREPHNRGLGLPLMVALMDEVSFARAPGGGTTVSLSVFLSEDTALSA